MRARKSTPQGKAKTHACQIRNCAGVLNYFVGKLLIC
jgi:hypothetical protein